MQSASQNRLVIFLLFLLSPGVLAGANAGSPSQDNVKSRLVQEKAAPMPTKSDAGGYVGSDVCIPATKIKIGASRTP